MTNQKITIFLSHSHKDIDKVRKIRDVLETLDCEPLIFFLKCLDDKNEELEEFIKEEIKARSIFVYCKSSNSENSIWVKKELEYINSFKDKRLYTIDIENDFSMGLINFLQQIAEILKRNRVFISYSHNDYSTVNTIINHLELNGYQSNLAINSLKSKANFYDEIRNLIDKATDEGIFIFVASANSINSKWCLEELRYAFIKQGYILPLIIINDNAEDVHFNLPYELRNNILLNIHKEPTMEELNNLIYRLKAIEKNHNILS